MDVEPICCTRIFFCCGGSVALLRYLVCHGLVKQNEIVLHAIVFVVAICYNFCCLLSVNVAVL